MAELTEVQSNQVAAVVVTFHPEAEVLANLAEVRPQVQSLIVVDNGSTLAELELLRDSAQIMGFELIENGENLGVATALNVGVRRALELGAEWILLFDQDSRVTPDFTATMLRGFAQDPDRDRIGILIPLYIDMRFGTAMDAIREPDGSIETAITSGSLVLARVFRELGLFVDGLFIDGVDHEFSLRLRAANLMLKECVDARLLHSPGTPRSHTFLRKKPFLSANYSPARRYYQERNKVWLIRRYWRTFPGFCQRQLSVSSKELAKIVLFEEDKIRKCRFFFRGIWHGLHGRLGRLE